MILVDYLLWRLARGQMDGHYSGIFCVIGFALASMAIIEVADRLTKNKRRTKTMLTLPDKITNPVSRALIEALQKGDHGKWKSLFAPNAQLFDDGNPRDLDQFASDALGHERFTSIDGVENNGLDITGHFHSERWGDFVTYFRLTVNSENKIVRLDIGQA